MTPTTIRHKTLTNGFAVVTAYSGPRSSFRVAVQVYSYADDGQHLILQDESIFSDERPAINHFTNEI